MADQTEGKYPTDVLKGEADGRYSREAVTIVAGAALRIGTVVGAIAYGAFAVGAASANEGNTGDGAVTLAAPAYGANVMVGTYTARCTAAASNAGKFELVDPTGDIVDGEITVGTAHDGSHLKFTIADGSADFVVGDEFTFVVTRAAGSGKYTALDVDATDGSEVAAGVLIQDASAAEDADVVRVIVTRHATVSDNGLIWPDGITDGEKAIALAQLDAVGIITRTGA